MKTIFSAALGTVVVISCWVGIAHLYRQKTSFGAEPIVHDPFDSSLIGKQISNNEAAVKGDPGGAWGWSLLCSAYLAKSRESDDIAAGQKAEMAARSSLADRKYGNSSGWNKLVQSLLSQHRFKDALKECDLAILAGVFDDTTIALKADTELELGNYAKAKELFIKHPRAFSDVSGQTIVSRFADLYGDPNTALAKLRFAAHEADQAPAMLGNALSWFHVRLGVQLARMGNHMEARQQYLKALTFYPRDYKALTGLARLAFQERNWQDAINWGVRSDAVAQMADTRAMVGDAYAQLGRPDMAERQYNDVAVLIGRPSGANNGLHEVATAAGTHGHRLDRQYAIFCADHGRDLDGAYGAAIRDFQSRRDIYAYDTLAWVCLKRGEVMEAREAMDRALSTGTKDAMLFYHAGCVYKAAGETNKSVSYFQKALAIDPQFDGIHAQEARELLAQVSTSQRFAKNL